MFYRSTHALNIYDSPKGDRLATQMAVGRYLVFAGKGSKPELDAATAASPIILVEDDYPGWLIDGDRQFLQLGDRPQPNPLPTPPTIAQRLSGVIGFIRYAMNLPHQYLWGGALGPNYDCSGLIQTAFVSQGIWLPRDAYQQQNFVTPIAPSELQAGDLVFFGTPERITHVGLALNEYEYLHCSGKDYGHNGIARGDRRGGSRVDDFYAHSYQAAGRVTAAYQSQTLVAPGGGRAAKN
ncbi:MAG: C40 family peptidase [Oscillatoriales cyanobacterium SM2_2_1]|nr:C40 family peptidase [Oscillatoriales cyanobacterium SM2_2_1]